ncbi:threonine dehydrogenase-like Zn-dependent dehydrogenase [Paenibacillus anaericanus]|uniref:zinc-dependent alcohol dehydrogenase n=1 Tax=Paenibacillus anaericanus TaxID=170367 RepID=UPI00278A49F7|nr:zinc-binding dehydrogenase [Paenibacillus anaericanus]MDQ0087112.1 threonine dehydrogenase-like Zn-dependent dehydrogenase [Paenibacillus anaericanus]
MKLEHDLSLKTRSMEALVWSEQGQLELCLRDEPQLLRPTDVKVKIHMTGICGTDLAVITGKELGIQNVIRGHEAVGTVVEVGTSVDKVQIGDRVVIDPNQSCNQCRFCKQDKQHLCIGMDGQGMRISGLNDAGTFAPFFVTDVQFIHPLSPSISWEAAVLVEPLACVLHNFREAGVTRNDTVLILGSGPMGILCQLVSKYIGCVTIATEKNLYRLSYAAQFSDDACKPEHLQEDRVKPLLHDRKFDVVIDTVGNQMETAERWVERGGRIIPFGINGKYQYTITPTHYTQQAIKIVGAGEYLNTFGEALQFAEDHSILATLVTKKYSLHDYETAIQELVGYDLRTGETYETNTLKTVFVFEK